LDLIFPKTCVGCGKWGGYVCQECEVGMWEEEQICPGCCRNSRYGLRHEYCKNKGYLDGVICLWAYEGITRKLIKDSKYKYYFDYLQELLVNSCQLSVRPEFHYLEEFIKQRPTVVPVPLHPKRERNRGFNQAEVIGRLMSRNWKLEMSNLLNRVKDTKQQVGRSREERLESMEGAFKTSPSIPLLNLGEGRVLLVDDVWTTGATMQECAKVLKKEGAKKVWGWVVAR